MPRLTAAKVEERLVKEFVRSRLPNVNYLQQVADQIGEPLVYVQDWFKQKRRDTPKPRQPVAAPAPVRPAVSRPRTRSRRQPSPAQSASPARVRTPARSPAHRSRTPVPPQPSNSARVTTPARQSLTRSPRQSSPAPTVAVAPSQLFPRGSFDTLMKPLIRAGQLPKIPWDLRNEIYTDFKYEAEDYSIVMGRTFKITETLGGFQVVDGEWQEIRNKVQYQLPLLRYCYPGYIVEDLLHPPADDEYDQYEDANFYRRLLKLLKCGNCPNGKRTLRCNNCFIGFCGDCVVRESRSRQGVMLNCPRCYKHEDDIFSQIHFQLL